MYPPAACLPTSLAKLLDNPILDQIPSCMACVDPALHLCWINRSLAEFIERYLGQPASECIGANFFDLLPSARASLEACFTSVRDTAEPCQLDGQEIRLIRDGQEISTFWDMRISPVAVSPGSQPYLIVLGQEVTAGVSRLRLERLFDQAMDAIVFFDDEGRVLDANAAACRLFEMAREELLGQTLWKLNPHIARVDFSAWWQIVQSRRQHEDILNARGLDGGETVEFEETMESGETLLNLYSSRFPLHNRTGDVGAVGCISLDITAWKAAEAVRKENETKFRKLVEQSHDGIILTDEEGRVTEWNQAEERITGIPASEAVGQYLWDLQYGLMLESDQTPHNYQRLKDVETQMLTTGQVPWLDQLSEVNLQKRGGERIRVQSSIFLIRTRRGYLAGSITREVTRERQIQEEINQRNRELTSLLSISQKVSGQLDLDPLLHTVTEAMISTLPGAESASIWFVDPDRDGLVCRSSSGQRGGWLDGITAAVSGNIVAQIFHSHSPVMLFDVDLALAGIPAWMDHPRALLGVPLALEGKPLGLLMVTNSTDANAFGEHASRWLQSLAGQVVVMIANARLFDQVSRDQERLRSLSSRLVEVQEEERRRIARELHDEVGQSLTGLKLLLRMTAQRGSLLEQNLKEARHLTNSLLNLVHDMSLNLRPAMLDDLGLLPALLWQFDRFSKQARLEVDFRHHGLESARFPNELETAAFRIIQEALTNVARHAGVERVAVWVWGNDHELGLQVEDHGAGFDFETTLTSQNSIGLNGIRERAALLGGEVTIHTAPGEGTHLRAVFPLPAQGNEVDEGL